MGIKNKQTKAHSPPFPFLLPTGCPGVGGTKTPLVACVTLVNHKVSERWFLQLQMKANIPVWLDCCGQGTTTLRKKRHTNCRPLKEPGPLRSPRYTSCARLICKVFSLKWLNCCFMLCSIIRFKNSQLVFLSQWEKLERIWLKVKLNQKGGGLHASCRWRWRFLASIPEPEPSRECAVRSLNWHGSWCCSAFAKEIWQCDTSCLSQETDELDSILTM